MLVLTCLVSRHFVTFILRIIYTSYVNYVKLEEPHFFMQNYNLKLRKTLRS